VRMYLRHQPRYNNYYVVKGLTPIKLSGYPMFFETKLSAIEACKERGWVLRTLNGDELDPIEPIQFQSPDKV
jgi:hypothetical protein